MMHRICLTIVVLTLIAGCDDSERQEARDARPNVLFILVDDLGWSDVSPFGSEIPTPNLDQLAAAGTRFTNFHTAMKCNPTRAMFLTGLDNNLAAAGGRRDWRLLPDVPTIAEKLAAAGYQSLMSGKWDAGSDTGQWPHDRGFDRTYSLLGAVASHFRAPDGSDENDDGTVRGYTASGEVTTLPEDFYSTTWYTDRMIDLLESRDHERPFFAYLSYTAPHYPLHAPPEYIERFKGWYEDGYRAVHAARIARLLEAGLLDAEAAAWTLENVPDWDSLSGEERAYEAKRMQVYAAMVAALDDGIGRVLDYLDQAGLADATLVIFASDNGADGTPAGAGYDEAIHANTVASIGTAQSYVTQGFNWAQTSSAPFRMVKSHPTEGGTRSPMIARWPGRIGAGGVNGEWFVISDLHAAILELAGIDDRAFERAPAMAGRSALGLMTDGEPIYAADETRIHTYVEGRRLGGASVLKGDWKLAWWKTNDVYAAPMLFNIATDPNETTDVSADHPDVVASLVEEWQAYAELAGEHVLEADPAATGN